MAEIKNISIDLLELNEGQMYGLPKNPRWIRDARFEALKKSIQDAPEMLELREILVYPLTDLEGHENNFIIVGGNMRFRACQELGFEELPCKIIPLETPVKKLREYVIKDNESFGQNDWDLLSSEWDTKELEDFGMELDYLAPGGGDNWDELNDPEANSSDEEKEELDDKYSDNLGKVLYEPKETHHKVSDLYTMTDELDSLIAGVQNAELRKMFEIRKAWFCDFNFAKVADYYAYQATPEEQRVFERLGLVLLDRDQLIENGFADIIKDFEDESNH